MRLPKMIPAAVAAIALLAAAPTGALAFPHSRCLSLNVAPRHTVAGDSVTAYGRLVCPRHRSVGGQTVKLFEHTYGTAGYTQVQTATTSAHGFFQFTPIAVQVNSSFYTGDGAPGVISTRRRVRVEALVTLNGPPPGTQLLTGAANAVTFTGTVSPADGGAHVILQRQNALTGNEWRGIGAGVAGPEGAFTIAHRFIVPGDANLRVLVRSEGRNAVSVSNELTYEISQAQNLKLTINASADPIAYGQSVTIGGVAAGLASQPVTLLARAAHQHGFAPVAEATTNASGEYTFPAQSPIYSMFYEVKAGGKVAAGGRKSAVLYEGVKDVLTAEVTPKTVQAGQPLTFSGGVTPSHPGHVVYLERQNASGNGFHVVQITSLSAASTYTMAYTVYDPGTKVFRVRVPGDPENEGAVSQLFTIAVTPAPASALAPEAPGNSSLPAEGTESGGEQHGDNEGEGEGPPEAPGGGEGAPGNGHHRGHRGGR